MRLPRKNDPASIEARRQALGIDGSVDLGAYAKFNAGELRDVETMAESVQAASTGMEVPA